MLESNSTKGERGDQTSKQQGMYHAGLAPGSGAHSQGPLVWRDGSIRFDNAFFSPADLANVLWRVPQMMVGKMIQIWKGC